jgi:uncharacterized protein YbcI
MKTIVSIFLAFTLLTSCQKGNGTETKMTVDHNTVINQNLNIIISPDISNRISPLYPKPLNDIEIINKVMDMYFPFLYRSGNRAIGQKDKILVQLTNPQLVSTYHINTNPLEINMSKMSNDERIKYLTDSVQSISYHNDKISLINEVKKTYEKALENTVGADIYGLFNNHLNENIVLKDEQPKTMYGKTVINKNRNILILLTDGYIEAGLYGKPAEGNRYFYLDNDVIKKFRKEFLASGEKDMKKFFTENNYGIMPVKNEALKDLEVFAIEFYDRSLSKKSGNNTVRPDDFEIIKLFWEDWLTKSGVKRYKIYERFASLNEFERAFRNFIGK